MYGAHAEVLLLFALYTRGMCVLFSWPCFYAEHKRMSEHSFVLFFGPIRTTAAAAAAHEQQFSFSFNANFIEHTFENVFAIRRIGEFPDVSTSFRY